MSITQSSTRFVALVAGVAVALTLLTGVFVAAAPAQAAALTQSQISSIISLLQSFGADANTIANVQASLNGQPTSGTGSTGTGTASCSVTWTQDLQQGSTGSAVLALQKILNMWPDTMVAVSGAGSPGNETTTFGPATKAAVIKFQTKYNVTPIAGYFGAKSRAQLAAICGGSNGGTVTPTGPGLTVSAAGQPANALAVQGASRVPFTTFTLTNNTSAAVTVNSVTVQRTGFANDSVFSGIVLLDSNGTQVGVSSTLNSNHQANIGSSFTLNAGQSMTFTVAGNMAASLSAYSGQIASLQVVAINTTAPVSGSLPINGASHTVNSTLAIGTATANSSSYDPNNAQTKNIGDTGVTFSGIRLQAGSAEDVRLYSIRWRVNGSISPTDLGNVMTSVNGTAYPTTLSSDGRYYTSMFSGGILVTKGTSVDVYVKGDVVGANASGRIAEFDIDKSSDVYLVGQTYGYGIIPTASGNASLLAGTTHASEFYTGQPWFQGSTISIQGGTVTTIQNATSVAAQNIAVNVPNQVLGGFQTNFLGEPVSVQTLVFGVQASTTDATTLTNVSIVDENGAVVAGPVDEPSVGGNLTFNNTITFPVGIHTYTLKGTVSSGAPSGVTYQLSTNPSALWTNVTGANSGNTVSLNGVGSFNLNTMTVQGLSLSIAASAQPASQNVVAGGQQVTFANVQLDASQSGENVRVNSLPLTLTTGGAANVTNLSACQLYDSNNNAINYGSNIVNTLATSSTAASNYNTFSFNNSLTVAKGTVTTLTLKCNISSNAPSNGTYAFGFNGSVNATVAGVNSGVSTSITPANSTSGTMTISSVSNELALSVDSSSPSYTIVAGGTTGVTVGVYKLHASNEAISLTKLAFTLAQSTTGSAARNGTQSYAASDATKVYIYNSNNLTTPVGTLIFTGTNTIGTSTLTTPVTLAANADTTLIIKADFADVGIGQAGGIGDRVQVDPSSAQGTGVSSGQTVTVGSASTVAGVKLQNTYPTLALVSNAVSGVNGQGAVLKKFTITANAAGPVSIAQIKFSIASSSVSLSNVKLFAYTDSGYSQGVSGQNSSGQIGTTQCSAVICPAGNTTFASSQNGNSPLQIAGGATMYFTLVGDATQTGSSNNGTVFATLLGDGSALSGMTSGYLMDTANQATSTAAANFVWSDNATTTPTLWDVDWTNGYNVSGLSSSGL